MSLIIESEPLYAVLGDAIPLNNRAKTWLWFCLKNRGADFYDNDFGSSLMDEAMAGFIKNKKYIPQEIQEVYNDSILPDEYFKWISPKDERQIECLLQESEREMRARSSRVPAKLFGRDRLIAMIDIWEEPIFRKKRLLNTLEEWWARKLQGDKVLDWFKAEKENEGERCNLAWEWLMKNKLSDSRYSSDSRILARSAPVSNYRGLLELLDQFEWTEEKKTLFAEKVKKNWSQRQYRKRNQGSKQCNLLLSNKAISRLEALAERYDLTKAKVVEVLLEMEMDNNGLYLSERAKKRDLS